jgi:periplasmic protein TonB
MSEKRPCVRCGRAIDEWSVLCPFCNWNQSEAAPAEEPQRAAAVAAYQPPSRFDLKRKGVMALAGVLLLIASFAVGMVINRGDAPKQAPKTLEEQVEEHKQEAAARPLRADTPLIPVGGAEGIQQPITSAPVAVPVGEIPNDYQRSDATAVSAAEYVQLEQRAKAERERMAATIDPRTLTTPAYAQSPPRPAAQRTAAASPQTSTAQPAQQTSPPPPRRAGAGRTQPVPEHRPLPQTRARGTARVTLLVGADGRVQQVDILKPLDSGSNSALVSAFRAWRFKPATENGVPVAAPYTVEISFERD